MAHVPAVEVPFDEVVSPGTSPEPGSVNEPVSSTAATGFFGWAVGAYVVVTAGLLVLGLRRTHGTFVYVLDDAAIHLSIAQNLAHHGTWGVTPHHFQSASSSPVWTVLLALTIRILPFARDYLPLLLNLVAGVWLLRILDRNQRLLRPSVRRPLHVVATFVIVSFVLFLPGLALTGMEHTLHSALLLAIVVLLHRQTTGRPVRWPRWVPYALIAVATLTRFETAMVALSIGIALLAQCVPRWAPGETPPTWRTRLPMVIGVGAASGVPLLLFAIVNKAMGQGILPNSVLDKSQLTGVDFVQPLGFQSITGRFGSDPLIPVLTFVSVAYLALCHRSRNRNVFPAVVMVAATTLHMTFSILGGRLGYERYQIYLIVLGVYAALSIVSELAEGLPERGAERVGSGVAVIVSLLVILAPAKWALLQDAPAAMRDTYQQRYQAGLFFERYYKGQHIATGELGYISLYHRGPITDLFGLGDYEVLRRRQGGHVGKTDYGRLAKQRGFTVVALYPETLGPRVPDNWIAVGTWSLSATPTSAVDRDFLFYATTPGAVRPLEAHLRAYAARLPRGVSTSINAFAEFRADILTGKRPRPAGDAGTCGRADCSRPTG